MPNNFNQYCQKLRQRFVSQDYKLELINKHIKTVKKINRKELLKKRDNATSKETKIPLVSTYNQSLTNISKVFRKCWNILSVNKSFKWIFQNEPVTAFKSNKNLKELIDSYKVEYSKEKNMPT